jgi:hypothetical protein
VTIVPEKVNVNYPMINEATINKTLTDRKTTVASRKNSKLSPQVSSNAGALISSAERNIEILETYRDIPGKI